MILIPSLLSISTIYFRLVIAFHTHYFINLEIQGTNLITTTEGSIAAVILGMTASGLFCLILRKSNFFPSTKDRFSTLVLQRRQLDYHFHGNTLQSINFYLLQEDKGKALWALGHYSELMKMNFRSLANDYQRLQQEINYLSKYSTLMSSISHKPIHVNIVHSLDSKQLQLLYPTFLIQPILENAITHNTSERIEITIDIKVNDSIKVTISDNGPGFKSENPRNKTGSLHIVSNRIKHLNIVYKKGHEITITQKEKSQQSGAIITITSPKFYPL